MERMRVLPSVIRSSSPNNSESILGCNWRGGLSGNGQDEAGERSRGDNAHLVDVRPAARQQEKEAAADVHLSLSGVAADGFGLLLLTGRKRNAQARRIALAPAASFSGRHA